MPEERTRTTGQFKWWSRRIGFLTAVLALLAAGGALLGPLREGAGWFVRPTVAHEVAHQLVPVQMMLGVLICRDALGVPLMTECILAGGRRIALGDAAALLAVVTAPAPTL